MPLVFLPNPFLSFLTRSWPADSSWGHQETQLLRRPHRKPPVETLQARAPRIQARICQVRLWRRVQEPESKSLTRMPELRVPNLPRVETRGRALAEAPPQLQVQKTRACRGSQSQAVFQDAAGERSRQVQFHMVLTPLRLFQAEAAAEQAETWAYSPAVIPYILYTYQ